MNVRILARPSSTLATALMPGAEDRIRTAKDTGLNHFPSRAFAINAAG